MTRSSAAKKLALRPIRLPSHAEFTTTTGVRVVVSQRGLIPLVSIRLVVRAGSAMDPPGKEGLADFTGRLLRRGTRSMSADALNERIEFVGGSLGTSVSEDLLMLSITSPSAHLGAMLEVMGSLVREPSFNQEEVDKLRERSLASLANDLDDPSVLADKALGNALWGSHPYAHDLVGNTSSVATFTREDVVRFHAERIGPHQSLLVITGAVDPEAAQEDVERAFAGFRGPPALTAVSPVPAEAVGSGEVLLVDKPDQTQSQIRIGALAYRRGHPDQIPASLINTVLGGGFTSRLVSEIRVNRGLSYGAGSHFDPMLHGGAFIFSSFTKSESTGELIEVALTETTKLRKKGATPRELESAKRYIAGLYPLRLETNESVSAALAEIRIYGLGDDWVERYRERLHAVTHKEAQRVANRYFFPEKPAIVVVGNAALVKKQLAPFGRVRVVKGAELV